MERTRALQVIIDDLQLASHAGACEISARATRTGRAPVRLWWRIPAELAPAWPDGSPFVVAALLWAVHHGEELVADVPISPRLAGSLGAIEALYASRRSARSKTVVEPTRIATPPPAQRGTACFFSRGVDSWHSVVTALEDDREAAPVEHLIYSPDFLNPDWPSHVVKAHRDATGEAATSAGCRLVAVETNVARELDGCSGTLRLASTALALGFSQVLIPSNANRRLGRRPRGSAGSRSSSEQHFSTERTEIVRYAEAPRLEKVRSIARCREALETLHVCERSRAVTAENCGRCEKCLRTMLALHIAGALERCPAFSTDLLEAVADMRKPLSHRQQWLDIHDLLRASEEERPLAAAVRLVIARHDLGRIAGDLGELADDPALWQVAKRLPGNARQATALAVQAQLVIDPVADRPGKSLVKHPAKRPQGDARLGLDRRERGA